MGNMLMSSLLLVCVSLRIGILHLPNLNKICLSSWNYTYCHFHNMKAVQFPVDIYDLDIAHLQTNIHQQIVNCFIRAITVSKALYVNYNNGDL